MTRLDISHDGDPVDGTRNLLQEIHLLRTELSGLREMLQGITNALVGAQSAYAAVAMRADMLEKRVTSKRFAVPDVG